MAIKIEVVKKEGVILPMYESKFASGMDLKVHASKIVEIKQMNGEDSKGIYGDGGGFFIPAGARVIIPSGLRIAIPQGYEVQLRSRSGLSVKKGLIVVQGIGTIDADYRGELGMCIANIGRSEQYIKYGERVCQMVVVKVEEAEFVEVEELSSTQRGSGGFGSTGDKESNKDVIIEGNAVIKDVTTKKSNRKK